MRRRRAVGGGVAFTLHAAFLAAILLTPAPPPIRPEPEPIEVSLVEPVIIPPPKPLGSARARTRGGAEPCAGPRAQNAGAEAQTAAQAGEAGESFTATNHESATADGSSPALRSPCSA
jgi:hypothetical protein